MSWNWKAAAALAVALAAASPAAAEWKKAESASFVVYSEASEEELREKAALLEDYHQFLRLLSGIADPPTPNKLRIYLVRSSDELREVRPVSRGVRGFYTASAAGIAAFAIDRESGGGMSGEQILLHEIAHHFMLQYRPAAYPAWYVEGFAEYVMTARFLPKTIDFGQPNANRVSWLTGSRWMPVERVLFAPPPRDREGISLYYAQSWLVTHYLLRDTARRQKLVAYLRATSAGTDHRRAFEQVFGKDLKGFDRDVRTYALKHMTYSTLQRSSAAATPAVRIERLPASADALLLAEAALHLGSKEPPPGLVERIRKAAAAHPDDPYARRVLAEAEVLHGDPARGTTLLDTLLAAAPQDAELLYLKGMAHLRAGRADEAKRGGQFRAAKTWFARAHKADPNHFPSLTRYAESLSGDERFVSDNTVNVLLLAHELAPQVHEITMNAAGLLLARGRHDEAERLLLPLSAHPHDAELAAAAQALLAAARSRAKEAPAATPAPATPPAPAPASAGAGGAAGGGE